MSSPRVILSHPRTQHAGDVARVLHARGWLVEFHSGYRYGTGAPAWARADRHRRALLAVPDSAVRRHWSSAALSLTARLAARLGRQRLAFVLEVNAAALFDRAVARRIARGDANASVVHAYQGAALKTLRAAVRAGKLGVLEVTSMHHHARRVGGYDALYPARVLDRVTRRISSELGLADVLVVPSPHVAAAVLGRLAPGARIVVAPYGVGVEFEVDGSRHGRLRRRGLVYVGSLTSLKGLWVLVEALDVLAAEGHAPVPVILLGREGREPELDRVLRGHPWIEVRGQVDQEAVRDAMYSAQGLLFPSLGDSFGRVQVEALACGTPVLASDASGSVVRDGCGAVHPAGDARSLASHIRGLLDGSLHTSAAACTQRARDFTWERFVEELRPAYGHVLQRDA